MRVCVAPGFRDDGQAKVLGEGRYRLSNDTDRVANLHEIHEKTTKLCIGDSESPYAEAPPLFAAAFPGWPVNVEKENRRRTMAWGLLGG